MYSNKAAIGIKIHNTNDAVKTKKLKLNLMILLHTASIIRFSF